MWLNLEAPGCWGVGTVPRAFLPMLAPSRSNPASSQSIYIASAAPFPTTSASRWVKWLSGRVAATCNDSLKSPNPRSGVQLEQEATILPIPKETGPGWVGLVSPVPPLPPSPYEVNPRREFRSWSPYCHQQVDWPVSFLRLFVHDGHHVPHVIFYSSSLAYGSILSF